MHTARLKSWRKCLNLRYLDEHEQTKREKTLALCILICVTCNTTVHDSTELINCCFVLLIFSGNYYRWNKRDFFLLSLVTEQSLLLLLLWVPTIDDSVGLMFKWNSFPFFLFYILTLDFLLLIDSIVKKIAFRNVSRVAICLKLF